MTTNQLDLSKKRWHRLFVVSFIVFSLIAFISIINNSRYTPFGSSWQSGSMLYGEEYPREEFSEMGEFGVNIYESKPTFQWDGFWIRMRRLILSMLMINLVYFEGVIYVITGKHGDSFYRWLLKKYHQLSKKI